STVLHFGWIPVFPVIQNRKLTPAPLCLCATNFGEILSGVGIGPVLPALDVAMPHRVVQDVVQCRPEMAIRFHGGFGSTMPHLPSRAAILVVPAIGCATVQLSQDAQQCLDFQSMDKKMVMVWEHDPGENPLA